MESSHRQESGITFRNVFPGLSDQELEEAERNFRRYLEIALQIRAGQGQASHPETRDIDTPPISPTMKERSNRSLKD